MVLMNKHRLKPQENLHDHQLVLYIIHAQLKHHHIFLETNIFNKVMIRFILDVSFLSPF